MTKIYAMDQTMPSLAHMVFGDGTPKKALVTALIVGSILTLINHGEQIFAGEMPPAWKVILTFLTPYCVTTWGAVTGKWAQWKLDFKLRNVKSDLSSGDVP